MDLSVSWISHALRLVWYVYASLEHHCEVPFHCSLCRQQRQFTRLCNRACMNTVCVCVLSLMFISYITRVGNEMHLSDVTRCARGVFNITPRYVMLQNGCMCCVCVAVKQLGTTNMLCMRRKPKTEHTHHRQLRLFKLKSAWFSVSVLWLCVNRRLRF